MTPLGAAQAEDHEGREEQIQRIVQECLRRLESGDPLSKEEIIAAHPHLMPELDVELSKVQLIAEAAEQALLEAWNEALERMDQDTVEHFGGESNTGAESRELRVRQTSRGPSGNFPPQIGKYPIIDRLGGGGQAEVYLAMHPLLRRQVVIKFSRRPLLSERVDRDRFIAEGKRLAELEHPHLARVYDLDVHQQHPFLVMQYVCGPNLRQYVQGRPVRAREAATLVARLARALAVAHARGIAHQDIKPENVVIDPSGQPVLIDFGLSVFHDVWRDERIDDDRICGTPEYMAPEQARGDRERSPHRSDVFALGAILYYLLTGEPPFIGQTRIAALQRAAQGEFNREALNRPEIPRTLAKICLRAMEANPADRYLTASEMAGDLERFLNRPKHWAMVGAGALVLAMVGVAIWQSWGLGPPSPPSRPTIVAGPQRPGNSQSAFEVRVWQNNQPHLLPEAVPLRTGDDLQVVCELPEGFHAGLFRFDTEAILHHLALQPAGEAEGEGGVERRDRQTSACLIWPEPGKSNALTGPPGTELIILCARRSAPPQLDEIRGLLADASPWPPFPRDLVLALNGKAVEVVPRPGTRNAGRLEGLDPHLRARAEALGRALAKKFDFVWGVAFAHVEPK